MPVFLSSHYRTNGPGLSPKSVAADIVKVWHEGEEGWFGVSTPTENRVSTPNFGERHRQGETISTAFVESTINQVVSRRFVKKQQMGWTLQGAHLLLQARTKVLNNELEDVFRRWFLRFRPKAQTTGSEPKAA
jgi:hypothetical protein